MLSFAHPAFLWLAPLALVPVILHLLSRIAPQSLRFPTTRFLHNSPMPLQGRRRWQDILLMFLRTALIATIVLLLAQPTWETPTIPTTSTKEGIVAILDVTPSMCACIEELRREAIALPSDTTFLSTSNQPITPKEWSAENSVADFSKALQNAAKHLSTFSKDSRTLHIFSDLQSSNWSNELPNMPEGTKVIVHSNATKVLSNWSVISTRCEYVGDNQIRILATCRNWGERAETRTIELELDGRTYRQELSLAPNSFAPALFLLQAPVNSHARISITQEDAFSFDDTRDFWATPEPPHPILAVFSGEDEKISEELEFFTIPALLSEPDDAPQRYAVTTLDVSGLPYAELSSQAAVFLLGASDRIDAEATQKLCDYVKEGGILLTVPGASPLVGWRNLQKTELAPRGTATLEKQPTGIGALRSNDTLFSLFPEKQPSDLHLFNIKSHIRISSVDNSDDVMLRTIDGAPSLIHRTIGKGQAFLFTFGFDTHSSDFPLTKSFLPLLRELLSQALGNRSEITTLICGESPSEMKSIDGTTAQVSINTSEPSITQRGNQLVEVIISPLESTIHYRQPEEISRALSADSATQTITSADANVLHLTKHCAYVLVILLFLEALLSIKRFTPTK